MSNVTMTPVDQQVINPADGHILRAPRKMAVSRNFLNELSHDLGYHANAKRSLLPALEIARQPYVSDTYILPPPHVAVITIVNMNESDEDETVRFTY